MGFGNGCEEVCSMMKVILIEYFLGLVEIGFFCSGCGFGCRGGVKVVMLI